MLFHYTTYRIENYELYTYLKIVISVKLNQAIRRLIHFGGGKIKSRPGNPLYCPRCVLAFPQLPDFRIIPQIRSRELPAAALSKL
jgi:hypothetical protein